MLPKCAGNFSTHREMNTAVLRENSKDKWMFHCKNKWLNNQRLPPLFWRITLLWKTTIISLVDVEEIETKATCARDRSLPSKNMFSKRSTTCARSHTGQPSCDHDDPCLQRKRRYAGARRKPRLHQGNGRGFAEVELEKNEEAHEWMIWIAS